MLNVKRLSELRQKYPERERAHNVLEVSKFTNIPEVLTKAEEWMSVFNGACPDLTSLLVPGKVKTKIWAENEETGEVWIWTELYPRDCALVAVRRG